MSIKPCIKCGATERYASGKCKVCCNRRAKEYAAVNGERVAARRQSHARKHAAEIREYMVAYRERNKKTLSQKRKVRYAEKRETLLEDKKLYYQENRESILRKSTERWNRDKKKIMRYTAAYVAKRRTSDPLFALARLYRTRTGQAFNQRSIRKGSPCAELLGCSWTELKEHIEAQFEPWMTWENRGRSSWHVDHRIPLASANTEEELKRLCHFSNLQPISAHENISKNSRLPNGDLVRRKRTKTQQ
jgi:hypothetical protein